MQTIEPLTPGRLTDLVAFFETRAFVDHPEWAACYCHFPHADHENERWQDRTGPQNRAATCARVQAGTMTGLLAYEDEEVIGWCNAGARDWIRRMLDHLEPPAEGVAAITCFVVAADRRGEGFASRLLQAACDDLASRGFKWVDAYPVKDAASAAQAHHGPLPMYLATGFEVLREAADGEVLVRRRLG